MRRKIGVYACICVIWCIYVELGCLRRVEGRGNTKESKSGEERIVFVVERISGRDRTPSKKKGGRERVEERERPNADRSVEEQQQSDSISLVIYLITNESKGITWVGGDAPKLRRELGGVVGSRPAVRRNDRPRVRLETFGLEYRGLRGWA